MAEQPLISVIIPVYNVENYLDECVKSVLNQTYRNTEIILVDDGSPDRCPEMCDAYQKMDSRVQVIHQKNGGCFSARNAALDQITGDYIAFLDSDDFWDRDHLETLYRSLRENDTDMVICNYRNIDEDGNVIKPLAFNIRGAKAIYTGAEAVREAFYTSRFGVAPHAKLYKKDLWRDIRFAATRHFDDLPTTYQAYHKAKQVALLQEAKMSYRIRRASDVHRPFHAGKISLLDSMDKILDYCRKNCPDALSAAESKVFASACHIYFQIPDNQLDEYAETVKRCQNIIQRYRRTVLLDGQNIRKRRVGAALSYIGLPLERKIFRLMKLNQN